MSDTILRMENITKIYSNGVVANEGINFSLKKGEIHALVGENGAGKSTLMKMLFGMEKPTIGKIILNDKEIQMNSSKEAIVYGIGMVHQHFMLVDDFTVAENITLGMEPKKGLFVDSEKAIKFTEDLGGKYNLKVMPKATVKDLPVGVKQKIEILKSLARGAKILILDEPTAVLTPQETDLLFKELIHLKKQGHTVIFITHKIREVKAISDRITVMRAGKTEGTFYTADVSEQEISNKIVGKDITTHYEKKAAKAKDVKLVVKGINHYDREGVQVLKDINFSVKGGMILGIAGVQGNGQVELIELLTRNAVIKEGSIAIKGEKINTLNVKALRNKGVGYIPEDRLHQGVAADANISENLISNQYTSKELSKGPFLNGKEILQHAKAQIESYKIKCFGPSQKISMLSGGNMQKVVVARECNQRPELLIVEQPARGVDIGAAKIIYEKLIALRDAGSAIVLVSADLNEVLQLSDALMVMYEGEIVAFFEDVKQIKEEQLGLCMLGIEKHSKEQIRRALSE